MGNIVVGNKLAKHLSAKLKVKFCPVEFTKFIDGPVKPRILNFSKAKFGILLLDMYQDIDINDYLINFLLLSAKMKEKCDKVIGIIPYLPYNRQDKEFLPGEPVSAKIIGHYLSINLDYFITCNNHNHRLMLQDLFTIPSFDVSLFGELGKEFYDFDINNTLIIGPDRESKPFVLDFIKNKPFDYIICNKSRNLNTNKVKITLPKYVKPNMLVNKDIIIVDDVIATGGTLLKLIPELKKYNIKSINFAFVHGLLINNTEQLLKSTKAKNIISTNTIFNMFAKVDCVNAIFKVVNKILNK
ncbi:MAG TPA: ribose-phosphate diphosphokinase [Candidatus Paceibacterota bacterium]|nr:ribose-phosphate diphosphokinase [Candidatus Paceibacterota bacterium]